MPIGRTRRVLIVKVMEKKKETEVRPVSSKYE